MHGRMQSSAGDECRELSSQQPFWILLEVQMCKNAKYKAKRAAAKKRARVVPEHVVELPGLDELPGYDDDEGVISD